VSDLKSGGRVSEEQAQKFVDCMVDTCSLLPRIRIGCMKCGARYRDTWWARAFHRLTCWFRRLLKTGQGSTASS
jgi:hypothetical protein